MIIKTVQQTCDSSCVMACLSMVTGISVRLLQERFNMKFPPSVQAIDWLLYDLLGSRYQRLLHPTITRSGIYMVSVPSLNVDGAMHCVILKVNTDNTFDVHDPNEGRPNKRCYTGKVVMPVDDEDHKVTLHTWTETVYLDLPGVSERHICLELEALRKENLELHQLIDQGEEYSPSCSDEVMTDPSQGKKITIYEE